MCPYEVGQERSRQPRRVAREDEHILGASARGYRSQEVRVAPTSDVLVPIRLARARPASPTPMSSLPEWRP